MRRGRGGGSGGCWPLGLGLGLGLLLLAGQQPQLAAAGRNVHFSLTADWPSWSLSPLQEASEYLATELDGDQAPFWALVDGLAAASKENPSRQLYDRAAKNTTFSHSALRGVWTAAVDATRDAAVGLHPISHALLELYLGMGALTPSIELHRSLRKGPAFDAALASPAVSGCDNLSTSWALVSAAGHDGEGEVFCSVDLLTKHLEKIDLAAAAGAAGAAPAAGVAGNLAFDHVYPANATTGAAAMAPGAVVTLYAAIGTTEFAGFHDLLKPRAQKGELRYVLRHFVPGNPGEDARSVRTPLQGYGVYLDIKNMEYKNLDDSGSGNGSNNDDAAGTGKAEAVIPADEEVAGLRFATLVEKLPALHAELRALRSKLQEEDGSGGAGGGGAAGMKAWKMRDFGLQAVELLSMARDPLQILMDLSQGFPSMARGLAGVKVNETTREGAMEALQAQVLGYGTQLKPGTLFLNGAARAVNTPTFNAFDILELLRGEVRALQRLARLPVPKAAADAPALLDGVLAAASASASSSAAAAGADAETEEGAGAGAGEPRQVRLDIYRGNTKGKLGPIVFLNNIESDAQYSRWPTTLRQLLFPSWQLQAIARNLYSLTVVVDVEGEQEQANAALAALATIADLYERGFPVRISVLFASKALVKAALEDPALLGVPGERATAAVLAGLGGGAAKDKAAAPASSVAVGLLYHHLLQAYGPKEAGLPFLLALSEGVLAQQLPGADGELPERLEPLTLQQAVEAYGKVAAAAQGSPRKAAALAEEGWAVLADGGQGLEGVRLAHKLVAERGLPVGCYLLNGLLEKGLDLAQTIMQHLGAEQQHLAQLVSQGVLTDKMKGLAILGKLLEGPGVYTRFHPAVEADFQQTARNSVLLGPKAEALAEALAYWHAAAAADAATAGEGTPISLWLVADLGSPAGLASAQAALSYLRTYNASNSSNSLPAPRLAVIHNPAAGSKGTGALFASLLGSPALAAAGTAGLVAMERLAAFLATAETETLDLDAFAATLRDDDEAEAGAKALLGLLQPEIEAALREAKAGAEALAAQARAVLGEDAVAPGEGLLVVNGRHVPLGAAPGQPLHPLDLEVVVQVEGARFSGPLHKLLCAAASAPAKGLSPRERSDLAMAAHSFLNAYAPRPRVDVEAALAPLRGTVGKALILEAKGPGPAAMAALERRAKEAKAKGLYDPGLGAALAAAERRKKDFVSRNLHLAMLLDPLSETAQRVSPLLLLARDHLGVPLTVLLAPHPELDEFPLKSYYRLSLAKSRLDSGVAFQNLPRQHVLTTRVDAPEPWNVQTRQAVQDLDNLKCDDAQCGDPLPPEALARLPAGVAKPENTYAELRLKNLLVYGQCFDLQLRQPVNGLQLTLAPAAAASATDGKAPATATATAPHHSDTLVMQNYGFFQLRADPGVWTVRLAEGRARELYELVREGADGALEPLPGQELVVVKRDFTHAIESLRVRKRAGMEAVPLLDDISKVGEQDAAGSGSGADAGLLSSLSKKVFGGDGKAAAASSSSSSDPNETVHVFSLATGHLYERMLKIMMLSVRKRTSAPVKFWLLENFLSPAFKTAAGAMAAEYGFEVEFITYKWPDWLRQQTEKQRIIWGYKILFLDVLFPLSVKKVIYVDADQVLRADLKELWDMDLKGRPYGYTPFCDSREETLGFQFWRSGYWANHLQGRPYHISALYVVDLVRFRQMAVGDKLRAIYDQLSRDPNSLANLDQDLPNYAQHIVPIFSLPQEWLWCESWCSDASKAAAKTIDLCNNPQHKEPKLDMARRVISGPLFNESWVELDAEVKRVEAAAGLLNNNGTTPLPPKPKEQAPVEAAA